MTNSIKSLFLAIFSAVSLSAGADVVWYDGSNAVSYRCESKVDPVVEIALQMFRSDMQQVTGKNATEAKDATIRIYEIDKVGTSVVNKLKKQGVPTDDVQAKLDAFFVSAYGENIMVVGNNGRGCAYGILELSRMAGVSPWIWWGDVVPEKKDRLVMKDDFKTLLWSGETERSLGYIHLKPSKRVKTGEITIRLKGAGKDKDAFSGIVEVAEPTAGELDLFKSKNGGKTNNELRIVEIDFLEYLSK